MHTGTEGWTGGQRLAEKMYAAPGIRVAAEESHLGSSYTQVMQVTRVCMTDLTTSPPAIPPPLLASTLSTAFLWPLSCRRLNMQLTYADRPEAGEELRRRTVEQRLLPQDSLHRPQRCQICAPGEFLRHLRCDLRCLSNRNPAISRYE